MKTDIFGQAARISGFARQRCPDLVDVLISNSRFARGFLGSVLRPCDHGLDFGDKVV